MNWLRDLDWTDVWHAAAVALFVLAVAIWADYVAGIVVASI